MTNIRNFCVTFFAASLFVFGFSGCGKPENTVIQPGELTAEQEAEMNKLGEDLKESMTRSPGKSGN